MDTSNLIVIARYQDEFGYPRFVQTISGGNSRVDSIMYSQVQRDRQVIVEAYTADESRLNLDGYDIPVTVQEGDVVPYSDDKVLAFVATFEVTPELESVHRLKNAERLQRERADHDKQYPSYLMSAALEYAERINGIVADHKAALVRFGEIERYLNPLQSVVSTIVDTMATAAADKVTTIVEMPPDLSALLNVPGLDLPPELLADIPQSAQELGEQRLSELLDHGVEAE